MHHICVLSVKHICMLLSIHAEFSRDNKTYKCVSHTALSVLKTKTHSSIYLSSYLHKYECIKMKLSTRTARLSISL